VVVAVKAERVVAVGITTSVLIGGEVVVVPVAAERVVTVGVLPFMWQSRWRGGGVPVETERVVMVGITAVHVAIEVER